MTDILTLINLLIKRKFMKKNSKKEIDVIKISFSVIRVHSFESGKRKWNLIAQFENIPLFLYVFF